MLRSSAHSLRLPTLCLLALAGPALGLAVVQAPQGSEFDASRYAAAVPNDAVTRLQQQIDNGTIKLKFDSRHGYLPAVLRALQVPISSQMLVFSKTSFQFRHITPETPRALYFNDDAFVGWVPGGEVMEVAAEDPNLGAVFYVLRQQKTAHPKFVRETQQCLQCHEGGMTHGVPGVFMRSVFTRVDGQAELKAGSYVTSDQSDFEERWGGWYVTGTHGRMRHMGNVFATRADFPDQIDRDAGANVTDLNRLLDTSPYLARTSDIVALMVAEHQTTVLNLIIRANHDTQEAIRAEEEDAKEDGRPPDLASGALRARLRPSLEPLVEALLFVKETRLTDRVSGTSGFTAAFQSLGPRDRQDRSLRDFDLEHRLFRYPCSYLIYSRAFGGLAKPAKDYVYRRLHQILEGKDQDSAFNHLSAQDRHAILEILTQTKPDFAAIALKRRSSRRRLRPAQESRLSPQNRCLLFGHPSNRSGRSVTRRRPGRVSP